MYDFIKTPSRSEDFIPTGVDKLDMLLEGGIPKGFMTLILTVPGSGCEILFKQIAASGDALIFSTEEPKEEIISTMKRFGWKTDGIEIVDIASKYIESPTMLEKVVMEVMNLFNKAPENAGKCLILDSLSTLMIYNDPPLVIEFFYHLLNKMRSENIHTISLVIEEGEGDKYINKMIYLNDKILKVRDTFI